MRANSYKSVIGYKGDNMTREELKSIFGEASFEGMDDVIKKIMDKQGSELTAKNSELADLQKKLDDIENAKLPEADKLKKALEEAEKAKKKADETVARNNREFVKFKVKNEFAASGLVEDDYKDFIDNLNFDNEEIAINSAKAMVTMLNAKLENAKAKATEEKVKSTPTPPPSGEPNDEDNSSQTPTRTQSDILKEYE